MTANKHATGFVKIRFYSQRFGATAGLVLGANDTRVQSAVEASKLFPYSEAMKMQRYQVSPVMDTWDKAFAYDFDAHPA